MDPYVFQLAPRGPTTSRGLRPGWYPEGRKEPRYVRLLEDAESIDDPRERKAGDVTDEGRLRGGEPRQHRVVAAALEGVQRGRDPMEKIGPEELVGAVPPLSATFSSLPMTREMNQFEMTAEFGWP